MRFARSVGCDKCRAGTPKQDGILEYWDDAPKGRRDTFDPNADSRCACAALVTPYGAAAFVKNKSHVDSLSRNGRGIRVEFELLADRYCHRVYVIDGQQSVLALESVEAETADSLGIPAYQDLNLQKVAGREFAALVGMSGPCHWSLTVEQSTDTENPGILFDAACRMKAAIPRVSSVYQLSSESTLTSGEAIHSVKTPLGRLDIAALSIESELHGSPPVEVAYHQQELLVRREIAPPERLPATVRWRYLMQLNP